MFYLRCMKQWTIMILILILLSACSSGPSDEEFEEAYRIEVQRYLSNYDKTLAVENEILNASEHFGQNIVTEKKKWNQLVEGWKTDINLASRMIVPAKYQQLHPYLIGFLQKAEERSQRILVYNMGRLDKESYFDQIQDKVDADVIKKEAFEKEKQAYISRQAERMEIIKQVESEIEQLKNIIENLLQY